MKKNYKFSRSFFVTYSTLFWKNDTAIKIIPIFRVSKNILIKIQFRLPPKLNQFAAGLNISIKCAVIKFQTLTFQIFLGER